MASLPLRSLLARCYVCNRRPSDFHRQSLTGAHIWRVPLLRAWRQAWHQGSHDAFDESLLLPRDAAFSEEALEERPLKARSEKHRSRGLGIRILTHPPEVSFTLQIG